MTQYLILFVVVLGVNLLPAFGPPTWSIVALYGLNTKMPVPVLVLTASLAAALGRFVLAHCVRLLRRHLPTNTKRNLDAARQALERRRAHAIIGLGLFALSPLPSAQLFEAAGLTGVRLLPFTAAFFAGRLISYSIYAFTAHGIRESSLGEAFRRSLTSPWGIALQLAMLAMLVLLSQINWARHLGTK